MIELEREFTYLLNELPDDLGDFPSKIIEDLYVPASSAHPVTRIRRNGDKYVITKKHPVDSTDGGLSGDSSRQVEHTIELSESEYKALASLKGKYFKKRRVYYEADNYEAEVDIYLDRLSGLVTVDFEFKNDDDMKKFQKPDFAGADVTQELIIAGGMLCGKSYEDIGESLKNKYDYDPVEGVEKFSDEVAS
jgi:Uncharacterized protein conserved in bacteria